MKAKSLQRTKRMPLEKLKYGRVRDPNEWDNQNMDRNVRIWAMREKNGQSFSNQHQDYMANRYAIFKKKSQEHLNFKKEEWPYLS